MPPPSTCEKFYQVPLTEERIHLVDTPEVLSRCQSVVLKVCWDYRLIYSRIHSEGYQ